MAIHTINEEFKVGTIEDWKAENKKIYDKIIEKNRGIGVEFDDWYDYIFDEFIKAREAEGIDIEYKDIMFSGFWSQGDGASFTGSVKWKFIEDCIKRHRKSVPKIAKFIRYHKKACTENPPLVGNVHRTSSHYSHENTVSFELEFDSYCQDYSVFRDIPDSPDTNYKYELEAIEKIISDELKDMMRTLYRELEKSYDYLTRDEAVEETLMANEYLFDAAGKMHNE
jgi:hypothetical protein